MIKTTVNTKKIEISLQFKITVYYLNIFEKCNLFLCKALQGHMILQKSFWYADLLLKKRF